MFSRTHELPVTSETARERGFGQHPIRMFASFSKSRIPAEKDRSINDVADENNAYASPQAIYTYHRTIGNIRELWTIIYRLKELLEVYKVHAYSTFE